jgi:hypothetical protein
MGVLRSTRRVVASLVLGGTLLACESNVATPGASSPVSENPSAPALGTMRVLSDQLLADSEAFRNKFGLRADEAWIRQVASRLDADWDSYGVPLAPDELADLNARSSQVDALKAVVIPYGLSHPDQWAGAFVDTATGVLVAQFSGDVDTHRAALFRLVSPNAPLEVRVVKWSDEYLRAQSDRIKGTDAWFATIPARLEAFGTDTAADQIYVRISSAADDAGAKIRAHFGWDAAIVRIESDGTGALMLPTGALSVVVTGAAGVPISGLQCRAVADMPGSYDSFAVLPRTDSSGRCRFSRLPATGYWIRIERLAAGKPPVLIALARATVDAGSSQAIEVHLQ